MALARWQATITDEAGNVLPAASVTVRREAVGSPLASLFSDRDGLTPTGNPITADSSGYAAFHVAGGAYRITATLGGVTREWRYVAVGLAAESDGETPGVMWLFDSGTTDADPGAGELRFNNATPGSATKLFISQTAGNGLDVGGWLSTWGSFGSSSNRGTLIIQGPDGQPLLTATVTGTVADDGAYYDVPITVLSASAAAGFVAGLSLGVIFIPRGSDGSDGSDGVDGITPGLPFNFSSTTTMADPGAGIFRLNNATLASVTAAAFDDQSAASGNPDVSAAVLSWDDIANAGTRGLLLIKSAAAPQNFALYRITGASTDNTGWTQLALTYVAHAGSFTNGGLCVVEFASAGADGATSVGKQTIYIPAAGMLPNGANPPLNTLAVPSSNIIVIHTRDFDPTSEEYLYFSVAMPKSWNEGTLSFQVLWSHAATTTNFGVVFALYANAFSDDDTLAQNAGTPVTVTDTGGTTNDLYISPESGALTVAGTPAENDIIHFRLNRVPGDASDTLAVDARVHGIRLFYTTNAATDA